MLAAQLWTTNVDAILDAINKYYTKAIPAQVRERESVCVYNVANILFSFPIGQQLNALKPAAEMVVYCFKVITDVSLHGVKKLNDPNHIKFLHFLLVRLSNYADSRTPRITIIAFHPGFLTTYHADTAVPDQPLDEYICKWMQLAVKLIIQLQQEKPNAFRKLFLAQYLNFFHAAVINYKSSPPKTQFPGAVDLLLVLRTRTLN